MRNLRQAMIAAVEFFQGNEEEWTQTTYARDERGYAVNPRSERATRWCMLGRIAKEYDAPTQLTILDLKINFGSDFPKTVESVNDGMSRQAAMDYVYYNAIGDN